MIMKIIVSKQGSVYFKRTRGWKIQLCPFKNTDVSLHCGDLCPLFHYDKKNELLHLCQGRTYQLLPLTKKDKKEYEESII